MPIEFDEMGVGSCLKCNAWVSEYDRFCDMCGIELPLPEKVLGAERSLESQLDADKAMGHDEDPVEFHWQYIQFKTEAHFCPSCGKRLREKTP